MLKIAGYEVHPAAARLPLMSEAELGELVEKIRANGQREKAVLLDGKLLDGRNRGRACELAGLQLEVREATAEERAAPLSFVLDANLHRRHLNESQRALLAAEALPELEVEAKARQRATLKRGSEAPSVPRGTHGDAPRQAAPAERRDQERPAPPPPAPEGKGRAAEVAAAAAGVGARSVARAKVLLEQAPPEVVEEVRAGKTTLKRAEKDIRRAKQIEQVKAYVPPAGEFPVIAADPPWPYEDELDGSDAVRGGLPYPPMTVEEICALKVPAAKDCILWLWVTNAHLLDGSSHKVLAAWGFTPKTMATWGKDKIGLGKWLRGRTEHVILAVKGKPVVDLGAHSTLFPGKVRAHSQKPEEFYLLVEDLCPATPRLEMFARAPRKGWVTSGAELPEGSAETEPRASTSPLGQLLAPERFAAEAKKLSFRTSWKGRTFWAGCGRARCSGTFKFLMTAEDLVPAAKLEQLREHARSHVGKPAKKKRGGR